MNEISTTTGLPDANICRPGSKTFLLTGTDGFLAKYVVRAIEEIVDKPLIDTLGPSDLFTVNADLRAGQPALPRRYDVIFHCAGGDPEADTTALGIDATENLLAALGDDKPDQIVFFSTTEIYGREEGSDFTEATIADPSSAVGRSKLRVEDILSEWCSSRGVILTILRCAPIVGTGMKGELRRMVNSIYRGTYRHIAGNEARQSVVHAVDVARAAVEIAPVGGVYNVTDRRDPLRHDLAEAFAARLDHKRVYTLSEKRARRWARLCDMIPFTTFGQKQLDRQLTTLTFSSDKLFNRLGWQPNSVTDYLKTHVYDQSSL